MNANERFEVRKAYKGRVDLVAALWDQSVTYLCEDLSPRGTFLETSFPLSIGETVVCSFRLPGCDKEYDLFGRVVRVEMPRRKSDSGRCGMGIRFVGISPRERLGIRSSLRATPPPLPLHIRKAA
jgi:hypothetical protein